MHVRALKRSTMIDERRGSNRLPIETDVRYLLAGGAGHMGSGRTLNMSGTGILFTTESALPEGERIQLLVSWPVPLNATAPLKLVAIGRLVRTEETRAAMSIERYEFSARGPNGF